MWSVIHLILLLMISVIAQGERQHDDSELQQETEKVTAGFKEVVMNVYENSTWELPYKCCMCKESVRAVRFLVINEIQEKAGNICSIIKSIREKCMKEMKIYQNQIIRMLFPGGPYGICKGLKVCK